MNDFYGIIAAPSFKLELYRIIILKINTVQLNKEFDFKLKTIYFDGISFGLQFGSNETGIIDAKKLCFP